MQCIPKHLVNKFLDKIKSGEITPEKLLEMDSAQRHGYFSQLLGEPNAGWVNALFESKMLLKAQKEGIVKWAEQVAGMKPEVKRDIITRVNRMDKLLTPEDQKSFLADLVEHKLGATVTMKEAANIAALSKEIGEKQLKVDKSSPIGSPSRMEYGRARVAFEDYVNDLKHETKAKSLREWAMPQNWWQGIKNVAGFTKALKASFDNSVIGRQGLKTMFTHPDIWAKNSAQSFVDFWKTMTGGDAMKEIRADILSRPNSLNGLYRKEGLAVGAKEEAFPTSLPEKIPGLGHVFKGSEHAFTGWQYRTRADVFDRLVDTAQKSGADTQGLGKLVNSLTGRGNIGGLERNAEALNNIMFSPRFLKSNIDLLTGHAFDKEMAPFARKEAAMNTVKVIFGVATVLAIAKALDPKSVEFDPRSADFGKIKIGNTRFDVSGGMSSIITLASRLINQHSKNSTTGLVTPINSGKYGAKTGWDVLGSFFEGKLSPAAGVIRDILKGHDFQGNHPTVLGEMNNLFTPLPVTNYLELKNDPHAAPMLVSLISDALGVGTNTYNGDQDWASKTGVEIEQFHKKVGDDKFKQANAMFNKRYDEWFDKAKDQARYQKLTEDQKGLVLSKKREEIKNDVFDHYGFKYKPAKSKLPYIK